MKINNSTGLQGLYSPSSVLRSKSQVPTELQFDAQNKIPSVQDRIVSGLEGVERSQRVADLKLERLSSGEEVDIHGTMIALQEADITLRFAVSIRDKLLEGYQKIINIMN